MPKFAVYVTSVLMMGMEEEFTGSLEGDNLEAQEAVELAKQCTQRISIGRVVIISKEDDSIVFEWTQKEGILFPPQEVSETS